MADSRNVISNKSKHIKTLFYILILLVNIIAFVAIGLLYNAYINSNEEKLFNENIHNVETLNTATSNAALTYSVSMGNKIDDIVNYVKTNDLDHAGTAQYLNESNSNTDREFQIIKSGSYDNGGKVHFGDYSGISIKKIKNKSGDLKASVQKIIYGDGYDNLYESFKDIKDDAHDGVCFVPEYVNPATKANCFAVYRHIDLLNAQGQKNIYTILLVVNSQKALNTSKLQNEYKGQAAVVINEYGDYIIKSKDFRNNNFYDYIGNYNDLSDDELAKIKKQITQDAKNGKKSTDLFYGNYRGEDCVFSVHGMENGWYGVTCVPLSSFVLKSTTVNYSLIIMAIFLALFITDGVLIYFVGRVMRYNIAVAEQATEAANEANKSKSRFLSTMSHELRTPLNAIIGFAAISKDSIGDPQALRDYLKKIDISSKLLLHLISDILDISAIESNKMKLNNEEFNMCKLIESLSDIYYEQCKSKSIEFKVIVNEIPSEKLIGDPGRVNQILLNFLSNAVKFTPSEGKITFIAEETKREDDSIVISFTVTDTGCGISEELRTRLFEPFERATGDIAHRCSGTGLGLSIAKNLTELMGGKISVESKEDEGSTFRVDLPFSVSAEIADEEKRELSDDLADSGLSGRRVLLVEDNAMNTEIAKLMLKKAGIAVETATNGKLGVEAFVGSEAGYFDAILMDVQMPVMNGYEATEAIRASAHPQAKTVPIISMTADAFSEDVEKAINAGMNKHLAKPIVPEELYSVLKKYFC